MRSQKDDAKQAHADVRRLMMGKLVTVTVDRPLGSRHPKFPALIYPVNYGFIQGVLAADGEEQDAYILGVEQPISAFTGRVIAIIYRKNDVEDKLVVAPDGMLFEKEEIRSLTAFQERHFDIAIEMIAETE